MDVLLIVFLTLLNGVFAMSEMALASSRKARLAALAEAGDTGAQAALRLMAHPTQFLSTVQIGITSIGVLNGIVGEAAFSDDFSSWLLSQGVPDNLSAGFATACVVTLITFSTRYGHHHAILQMLSRIATTHYRRYAQFTRNNRCVASTSTTIRNNCRSTLHHWFPVRVRHISNQYITWLNAIHFTRITNDSHRACANLLANCTALS